MKNENSHGEKNRDNEAGICVLYGYRFGVHAVEKRMRKVGDVMTREKKNEIPEMSNLEAAFFVGLIIGAIMLLLHCLALKVL